MEKTMALEMANLDKYRRRQDKVASRLQEMAGRNPLARKVAPMKAKATVIVPMKARVKVTAKKAVRPDTALPDSGK